MRAARKTPESVSPQDAAAAAYNRANRLDERGDRAGAMRELKRAYELDPDNGAIIDRMATTMC